MMRAMLECAELRVQIKMLQREGDDTLRKADRGGLTAELLSEYENIDTRILTARLQLVDRLRKHLRERVAEKEAACE